MRKTLLLLLLSLPIWSFGQNYQCLQAGAKRYFTNSNSYLRGMRIDSVRSAGSDMIFYPFHTPRGKYRETFTSPLDTTGGSWLGKRVIMLSDGTFLFDNIWLDTIVIKTQAHTGDSWVLYNDTTAHYYKATLTAEDTMTVLGAIDSVKKITINAYGPGGLDPTDSMNNFKIVLSKNAGFVKVFDLYTFPYHKPDTLYGIGNDFYLDYVTGNLGFFSFKKPNATTAQFELVALHNPTYAQLYDWNIGDMFENKIFSDNIPNDGFYPYGYYFDSIISKAVIGSGVVYGFTGWIATQHRPVYTSIFDPRYDPSALYLYDTFSVTGSFSVTNNLLIDTVVMQEETGQHLLQFYKQGDTSFCSYNDWYHFITGDAINPPVGGEASPLHRTYKTGIGLINYDENVLGGSPPLIQDTTLLYYVKSGMPCGHFVYPSPINYLAGITDVNLNNFSIYPSPANDKFVVQTTGVQPFLISVYNTMGQAIITQSGYNGKATVNVSHLPSGVYSLALKGEDGSRYTEKVVVVH